MPPPRPRARGATRAPEGSNGPAPADDRVVDVGGLEIYVRERGTGHPLVMINGLGGNLEMWGPAETALAEGSRLIMFDGPGMGRSQTPVLPKTVSSIAKTVCRLLDELGYHRVDLLGYSMGGVIAQQVARIAPERIRRMALVATACGWGSVPAGLPALSVIAMPLRYYSRQLYRHTNRLIGEPADRIASENAQVNARMKHPPSLLGYAYLVCAGATWTSLPWLPSITIPTVVLSGTTDRLVPLANSYQLSGLLPNSRLQLVPDEGHLLLFSESAAHPLLAEWFSSPTEEASSTWQSGAVVDEEMMHAAVRESKGGQPTRALSDAFRWCVGAVRSS
jgi:poly(3-hydroxyoctanoate) depolymerase